MFTATSVLKTGYVDANKIGEGVYLKDVVSIIFDVPTYAKYQSEISSLLHGKVHPIFTPNLFSAFDIFGWVINEDNRLVFINGNMIYSENNPSWQIGGKGQGFRGNEDIKIVTAQWIRWLEEAIKNHKPKEPYQPACTTPYSTCGEGGTTVRDIEEKDFILTPIDN